jgi:glyoxylase I family protein
MQVRSADHITIIVSDIDATRKFYVQHLGLVESDRPDFDFSGAWFVIGDFQIHATVASELAGQAGWGDRSVKSIARGHHFAFRIDSVDAAVEQLNAVNIPIAAGPQTRPDGVKQIYIRDPDDHLVELFSC